MFLFAQGARATKPQGYRTLKSTETSSTIVVWVNGNAIANNAKKNTNKIMEKL